MANARSVIVCALNYNSAKPYSVDAAAPTATDSSPRGWISRYAWGTDYHEVLGAKLESLVAAMRIQFSESHEAKWYVDTGPIHERAAAAHAGLGWLAKNTLLINPEVGSWLFLGVILTTLDLAPSLAAGESLPADQCGQCTLCIDACPTAAIVEPYVLDARRCISYLTIELRGAIPEELRAPMGANVFGCDICQDVCPWNRQTAATKQQEFAPREKLFSPELEWLARLSEEDFREVFRGSPVKRTKWRGLIRSVCVALGNSALKLGAPAHTRATTLLARLAQADDALIAEHARWALAKLGGTSIQPPITPAA
jgi:epoxyqueuosine reductase